MPFPLSPGRASAVRSLASHLTAVTRTGPLRVGVDGRTAAGKTTLADELATELTSRGANCIRTSIDGFHRPRAQRYMKGRYSPEGYLDDARDWAAIRRVLLDPLGAGGSRRYQVATFDLEKDVPVESRWREAPASAVLIVDGTFLQRPELAGGWDVVVFVEVSRESAMRRGVVRDAAHLGGEAKALRMHRERYQAAFSLYEVRCSPRERAHFIWQNEDPFAPVLSENTSRLI